MSTEGNARSKPVTALMVLLIAMVLLGCSFSTPEEQEKSEGDVRAGWSEAKEDAKVASDVSEEWKAATGEDISTDTMNYATGDLSESHAVMAAMILQRNGMDSNLDSYESVGVMEFVDAGGVERAAVVIDGKVVLPKQQQ